MDTFQIISLAIVQGLTEFLPVSSSGHLILPARLLGWQDQGLTFDVATHLGTLLAVILYFRKDIGLLTKDWIRSLIGKGTTRHSQMAWFIILATIPAVIFGLIIKKSGLDESMRSLSVIVATTLIFGALLGIADYFGKCSKPLELMGASQAIGIGFAQMLAIIPGTSRSGITITAALMLGFTREASARFSFLLSIPIIIGAGLLLSVDFLKANTPIDWYAIIMGTSVSGLSAFLCIHLFLNVINRIGLMPFVVYRLALGLVLFFAI
ncbi:MAG: undecaprenyl-diphosphate phosphatase [Endozoicomonas sp. (ex Botrylloides leachii)]|nr:undecaprenyl-diphosphate phosphatase [Endozoicomonas sp. (ex Botrylloides leachii)]